MMAEQGLKTWPAEIRLLGQVVQARVLDKSSRAGQQGTRDTLPFARARTSEGEYEPRDLALSCQNRL